MEKDIFVETSILLRRGSDHWLIYLSTDIKDFPMNMLFHFESF